MKHKGRSNQPKNEAPKYLAKLVRLVELIQSNTQQQATNNNDKSPNEDALVAYTRSLKNATWIIAIAGILAFGAALLQWSALHSTDEKIKGQLDEMQAARRPWITLDFAVAGPLVFRPTPHIPLKLTLANIGPTPALEAWGSVLMFPIIPNDDAVKEMHKRCGGLREDALKRQGQNPRPPGFLLFPNRKVDFDPIATVTAADHERWKAKMSHTGVVLLDIAICGLYRASYSPEVHSTMVLSTLGIGEDSPFGRTSIWAGTVNVALVPELGQIAPDKIKFYQEPFGTSYAD